MCSTLECTKTFTVFFFGVDGWRVFGEGEGGGGGGEMVHASGGRGVHGVSEGGAG